MRLLRRVPLAPRRAEDARRPLVVQLCERMRQSVSCHAVWPEQAEIPARTLNVIPPCDTLAIAVREALTSQSVLSLHLPRLLCVVWPFIFRRGLRLFGDLFVPASFHCQSGIT